MFLKNVLRVIIHNMRKNITIIKTLMKKEYLNGNLKIFINSINIPMLFLLNNLIISHYFILSLVTLMNDVPLGVY